MFKNLKKFIPNLYMSKKKSKVKTLKYLTIMYLNHWFHTSVVPISNMLCVHICVLFAIFPALFARTPLGLSLYLVSNHLYWIFTMFMRTNMLVIYLTSMYRKTHDGECPIFFIWTMESHFSLLLPWAIYWGWKFLFSFEFFVAKRNFYIAGVKNGFVGDEIFFCISFSQNY